MNILEKLFKRGGGGGGGGIARAVEALGEARAQNPQIGTGPNDYGSIMRTVDLAGAGMKKGGKVKSASARADGIAIRGKTRA